MKSDEITFVGRDVYGRPGVHNKRVIIQGKLGSAGLIERFDSERVFSRHGSVVIPVNGGSCLLLGEYSTSSIVAVGMGSHARPANAWQEGGDGAFSESIMTVNARPLTSFTMIGILEVLDPDDFFPSTNVRAAIDSSMVFPAMPPPGLIQYSMVCPVFLQVTFPQVGTLEDLTGLV
jgi:hypothetical protein